MPDLGLHLVQHLDQCVGPVAGLGGRGAGRNFTSEAVMEPTFVIPKETMAQDADISPIGCSGGMIGAADDRQGRFDFAGNSSSWAHSNTAKTKVWDYQRKTLLIQSSAGRVRGGGAGREAACSA